MILGGNIVICGIGISWGRGGRVSPFKGYELSFPLKKIFTLSMKSVVSKNTIWHLHTKSGVW